MRFARACGLSDRASSPTASGLNCEHGSTHQTGTSLDAYPIPRSATREGRLARLLFALGRDFTAMTEKSLVKSKQCPLIIREKLEARHPSSLSAVPLNLYETCPSSPRNE